VPRLLIRALLPALLTAALLAGCTSSSHRAPVEQRPITGTTPGAQPTAAPAAPTPSPPGAVPTTEPSASTAPLPPGAENAGKPGYYTVKPGDTMVRIGLENGQNWRDIARWNGIENPNVIEVGQVLRVVPPTPAVTTQPVAAAPRIESRPLDGKAPAASASAAPGVAAAPAAPSPPAALPPPAASPAAAPLRPTDPDEDVAWAWPAAGPVATPFDDAKNKGLAITGKAGDPVLAAADGRVVYAGSGLRGYGNLVIVKHNNTYLTAYAHNQALLVKDDQVVRRGQKIAEMGSSEADRVQLHFEIRRQGKPVDPARLLPPR
jgi:lipoprotein NlpD